MSTDKRQSRELVGLGSARPPAPRSPRLRAGCCRRGDGGGRPLSRAAHTCRHLRAPALRHCLSVSWERTRPHSHRRSAPGLLLLLLFSSQCSGLVFFPPGVQTFVLLSKADFLASAVGSDTGNCDREDRPDTGRREAQGPSVPRSAPPAGRWPSGFPEPLTTLSGRGLCRRKMGEMARKENDPLAIPMWPPPFGHVCTPRPPSHHSSFWEPQPH